MRPTDKFSGFTLVEIIVVIVLVGILASVAAPRFISANAVSVKGLADEIIAAALYARQSAFSNTSSSTHFLVQPSSFSVIVDGSATLKPDGSGPYTVTLSDLGVSGISLGSHDVAFDALGGTPSRIAITISGAENARTVCIETTGYVHNC